MFRKSLTTWPLMTRVLWIVAMAIETIVATCGIVMGTRHIRNDLLSLTMAMLIVIALGCQVSAMIIRAWKQATGHDNTP